MDRILFELRLALRRLNANKGFSSIAILSLAFAYGAWTLKSWGWTLGIAAEVIGLVLSVLFIVNGSAITSQAISIVIAIAIIYYLMTPNVKAAFGRA